MSKKGRQTFVLEHWFGVDSILFGGNPKNALREDDYEQYCVTKGAFLTNLYEIYLKLGYNPNKKFKSSGRMLKDAVGLAENAVDYANKIMKNSSIGKMVKEEIREAGSFEGLDEKAVARYIVMKRRNAVALDAMTMGKAVKESASLNKDDWQNKVLFDAHKTLRDTLIDISLS